MPAPKIWNGTAWVPSVFKTWSGTVWYDKWKLYTGTIWTDIYGQTLSLSVDLSNVIGNTQDTDGICQSGIRIGADGKYYTSDFNGAYGAAVGDYILGGTSSQVWVQRAITAGTLTSDGIGASRVSCSTNRVMSVTQVLEGTKFCTFTLSFYDAASGGNLLGSKSVTISATNTNVGMGCPTCCFTPDTEITMAHKTKRIADVKVGDMIMTENGPEEVHRDHHQGRQGHVSHHLC